MPTFAVGEARGRSSPRPWTGAGLVPTDVSPCSKPALAQRGRSGLDRDALEVALVRQIESNPGKRVEQIDKALRTTTKDVRLPLVKLVNAGTVNQRRTPGNSVFPCLSYRTTVPVGAVATATRSFLVRCAGSTDAWP